MTILLLVEYTPICQARSGWTGNSLGRTTCVRIGKFCDRFAGKSRVFFWRSLLRTRCRSGPGRIFPGQQSQICAKQMVLYDLGLFCSCYVSVPPRVSGYKKESVPMSFRMRWSEGNHALSGKGETLLLPRSGIQMNRRPVMISSSWVAMILREVCFSAPARRWVRQRR